MIILQITPILNPGCRECTSKDILVYIKAEGSHDTLHVFWDFQNPMFGSPTVHYVVTQSNATLKIVWDGTLPFIDLPEKPDYLFLTGIPEVSRFFK